MKQAYMHGHENYLLAGIPAAPDLLPKSLTF
jgi:hypothetical protein